MQKLPFIIQIRILIAIYLKSVLSQYETPKNIWFLKLIIFVNEKSYPDVRTDEPTDPNYRKARLGCTD